MEKTIQMIQVQNIKTMEMTMTILINLPLILSKTNQELIKIQELSNLKNMIMSMITLLKKMQRNPIHLLQTIQKRFLLKDLNLNNLSLVIKKKVMKNPTTQKRKKVSRRLIDKINFKFKSTIHLNLNSAEWVVEECLIQIA